MNNPFAQVPETYKISFKTIFADIEKFENLYNENCLGISCHELESQTVESAAHDIWCIEIYLDHKPEVKHLQEQLRQYADDYDLELLSQIICEKIIDQDWVLEYQKNLKPIEIENFFITSLSQTHLCPKDKINIVIEASRAFGTGEHATTSGCVRAIKSLENQSFANIIDIGTGSGILSFVAKKLWPKAQVHACDVEQVAIEVAHAGAKINKVDVNFYQNTADEVLNENNQETKFDLIISNILARPLIHLAEKIKNIAANNSYIILSGFLDNQASEVIAAYSKHNFELISKINIDNWQIIIMNYDKNK